ncbi:RrF2 family transcriptional regulator [Psychrobacter sp. I-STPA10]|uniref:RrF2 family transcriptional regulator n=1 Tax=Psychrobacter sp. I-STPA10 TaxID=2585769 RepID=UPI001E418BC5|nr:Rrf2 family transcriptional regulator [Psychrobacter sp. I-STPA10]
MRLTSYSDYALRTLMYLAVMPNPDELATIADIAEGYQISKSHLTKIIHQLAQLGYIDSVRGKNGGIRLAKLPKDINLGEVLRHTEADFAIVPCLLENGAVKTKHADKKMDGQTSIQDKETADKETASVVVKSDNQKACFISPTCQLKHVFAEATQAFIQVLSNYTLADITQNKAELSRFLQLSL